MKNKKIKVNKKNLETAIIIDTSGMIPSKKAFKNSTDKFPGLVTVDSSGDSDKNEETSEND